jgi:Secretion system C-terminal sorting domain
MLIVKINRLMKPRLLFVLLFFSAFASAQTVSIPDSFFKNYLLSATVTNHHARDINNASMIVDTNADGAVQQAEADMVYTINIPSSTGISSLSGIQSFTNLTSLICKNNNSLTLLDVSGMVNLVSIDAGNNSLATLNLSGCTGLVTVNCWGNELTALELTGLTSLENLYLSSNNLTEIDLSPVSLTNFIGDTNLFTTLDFSTQTELDYFNVFGCTNLTSVYVKNGHTDHFDVETFGACTSLNYICIDEEEYDLVYNTLVEMLEYSTAISIENITFTTDCNPEVDLLNSITGTVKTDLNNDGCDAADSSLYFFKIAAIHNGDSVYRWTNAAGHYDFAAYTGDYQLSVNWNALNYFTYDDAPLITFDVLGGTEVIHDFCIQPAGIHPDLEITISPCGNAQPGFSSYYYVSCRNKGNQTLSGTYTFNFDENLLNYVQSSLPPVATGAGSLTWQYDNLLPLQFVGSMVTLSLNSPTDSPAVNLGDILTFSAAAPIENDETPANNTFEFNQTVVGSQDPNNIVCLEGATVPTDKIGEYLHYTINFENIGNAAADFVVVTDEIDADKYDLNSVEVLHSTHAMTATQEGNILTFRFNDIALAPQAYGSVSFKIKSLGTLQQGDDVMSQASIVFDYNEPLVTNEAVTAFDDVLSTNVFSTGSLNIYPNPAQNLVSIKAGSTIKDISLYDIRGRLLLSIHPDNTDASLDVSAQPAGVYLLKIATDTGSSTRKLVKE